MDYDNSTLNQIFASKIDDPEMAKEAQEKIASFIRTKLREESFARKILPPETVTKSDCQIAVDHDTMVKIVSIEPDSKAMPVTFRGRPTDRYVTGERFEIKFFSIFSDYFRKAEQELLAYDYPITKVIEHNTVKDIHTVEDSQFIAHVREALRLSGKTVNSSDTRMTAANLKALFNLMDGNKLKSAKMLMTLPRYNDTMEFVNLIQPMGTSGGGQTGLSSGDLAKEIIVDGFKYHSLFGRKVVTTIKNDLISDDEIFIFAEPKFLGKFYILNETKFYLRKVINMIEWVSWEDIAMGFGNINGIGCLKLNQPEE